MTELPAQAKYIGSIEFRFVEPPTMAGASARALRSWEARHAVDG